MPIPTMEDAFSQMEKRFHAQTGATTVAVEYFPAVLQASVAKASAETIGGAVSALTTGIGELRNAQEQFTAASATSTSEMVKWSQDTAAWTRRLTVATWALFIMAGVQALAAIAQVFVALGRSN